MEKGTPSTNVPSVTSDKYKMDKDKTVEEDGSTPVVIGVDVGGTNTDAVVMCLELEQSIILSSAKTPTTSDITSGIRTAMYDVINKAVDQQTINVTHVNIGTTNLLDAVVEERDLARVAVIRLCGPASRGTPPFSDIPDDMKDCIDGGSFMVSGGYEFDGREISAIDLEEVNKCLDKIEANNVTNIVVCGIFSSVNPNQERKVKNFILKTKPDWSVTISTEIGQSTLLRREGSAILNECLKPLCKKTIKELRYALDSLNLKCPMYLTQNDGTILSTSQAMEFPVLTFACGPSNSIKGAYFLTGLDDGIVIDVGGTTIDIGVLCNGFPRQAHSTVEIGNIKTNLRMPDVLSFTIGGATHVNTDNSGTLRLGVFCAGVNMQNEIKEKLERSVEKMKDSPKPLPVIVVGGGCAVLDTSTHFKGASFVVCPQHAEVANAVGAALSTVSYSEEYVLDIPDKDDTNQHELIDDIILESKDNNIKLKNQQYVRKDVAMKQACQRAVDALVQMGAKKSSVKITEKRIVSESSSKEGEIKLKIKVMGTKKMLKTRSVISRKLTKLLDEKESILKKQTHTSTGIALEPPLQKNDFQIVRPRIMQNREWILTERDIECITIGAGILGCGGGGSAHLGRLLALKALKDGKTMRVVDHNHFCQYACAENDVAVIVAIMGSPAILEEKTVNNETVNALNCLQDVLMEAGSLEENIFTSQRFAECIETNDGVKFIDNFATSSVRKGYENDGRKFSKRISALMCVEMGGMNTIAPLLVAADLNLPVLDCDGMGRAFPELQMIVPFMYGCSPYPVTLSDCKNRRAVVLKVNSIKQLEDHFRKVVVEMGGTAGIAFAYLNRDQIRTKTVPNSLSRSWFIGDAVQRAISSCKSPVEAVINQTNGKLLITGKIVLVRRDPSGGFNNGQIFVASSSENDTKMKIDFHNENILARFVDDENEEDGKIVASVPDLITIIDNSTGESIQNENVRYGMFVAVLLLPASSMLRTERALQFVGPKAFGYFNFEHVPCSEFDESVSVIKEFYNDKSISKTFKQSIST